MLRVTMEASFCPNSWVVSGKGQGALMHKSLIFFSRRRSSKAKDEFAQCALALLERASERGGLLGMNRVTAGTRFLTACETHREDLRKVLELYRSGKVRTHEDRNRDTTDAAIDEVLARLAEWDKFLNDK